jgi:hypothetical protein
MDFEGALRARLLAAAPVTEIVGQRIYWEERPQNAPLPAITLQYVVDARDQHMGGFQAVQRKLIQIDVWATTYAQKKALKEAVITTLATSQISNGIFFRGVVDVDAVTLNERTETQFIYRDAIRLTLFFSPA